MALVVLVFRDGVCHVVGLELQAFVFLFLLVAIASWRKQHMESLVRLIVDGVQRVRLSTD